MATVSLASATSWLMLQAYTQYQAAQAIKDAANNPNGGLAGLGVGLGAGTTIGNIFANNVATENKPKKSVAMTNCTKCGAEIKQSAKFCPECGTKQGLTCSKCGATLKPTAKFCSECGTATGKTCKCGAKLRSNAKFCPECGEKVSE